MGHPAASAAWPANQLATDGEGLEAGLADRSGRRLTSLARGAVPDRIDPVRTSTGGSPYPGHPHCNGGKEDTHRTGATGRETGGWIYVSALFGADPLHHAIPEDARAEAEQIFTNLLAILTGRRGADQSIDPGSASSCGTFSVTGPCSTKSGPSGSGDHRPARSAIQAPDFGRKGENARFMIEVTAYRG